MTSAKNLSLVTSFLLFSVSGAISQTTAEDYVRIAEEFKKKAQPDSAIFYYEKAAGIFQSQSATGKFINACNQVGVLLTRQDKYEAAKAYLNKALSAGLTLPDTASLYLASTYIGFGVIYNAEKDYATSLFYHNKSLAIRLAKLGEYHSDVATNYGNIGNVYLNARDFDRCIEAHLKSMNTREKLFGKTSVEIAQSYTGLGNAYREKKDYQQSVDYFQKALQNKIIQLGQGHKDLVKYYTNISEVYYLMNNQKDGDFYKGKSEEISKTALLFQPGSKN